MSLIRTQREMRKRATDALYKWASLIWAARYMMSRPPTPKTKTMAGSVATAWWCLEAADRERLKRLRFEAEIKLLKQARILRFQSRRRRAPSKARGAGRTS